MSPTAPDLQPVSPASPDPGAAAAPAGGPWPEPWCAQPWNRPRSQYWDMLTGTWVPCPQASDPGNADRPADRPGPRAGD